MLSSFGKSVTHSVETKVWFSLSSSAGPLGIIYVDDISAFVKAQTLVQTPNNVGNVGLLSTIT